MLCTLALSGCVSGALSRGSRSGATAVERLRLGAPLAECLASLSLGGTISVEPVEAPASGDALDRLEAESGVSATRLVNVSRHWGFLGYDVVQLFLDDRGHLVAWRVTHFN